MNDYIRGLAFVVIGLIGGAAHYLKKRYVDNTTDLNFIQYLLTNRKATLNALFGIIAAEIPLSLAGIGPIGLGELSGAFTAGYVADSSLNKTL